MQVDSTRTQIREEIQAGTRVTVQLLSAVVRNTKLVSDEQNQQRILLDFLDKLGRVRANEIHLYATPDNQIYVSPPSPYKVGRDAPQWFSKLVMPKFDAVKLSLPVGELRIVPDASRATLDAWDDFKRTVWIFLGFFVLVNVVVFWFVGRALAPVKSIVDGLSNMQAGRYDARLPKFALPEMSAIANTFNRMAETLAERTQENNRLALVVQQTSDAILIHDHEGKIIFSNPAATALFGNVTQQLVGQSGELLVPAEKNTEFKTILDAAFCGEPQDHLETQRITAEGKVIDVSLSAAPLVDPQSRVVIGMITSLHDITDNKAAERTARELDESRRFSQLMQQHVEQERASMARELHDELGQNATAIKTLGMSIANRSAERMPEIKNEAQMIVTVAGQLYDMVHGMISQLRPPVLDHLGLADALRDAVFTWQKRHPGITLNLQCADNLNDLPEPVNIAIYRIVQECLTNVARHAKATAADIRIERDPSGAILLEAKDNGVGNDAAANFAGARLGLRGMRERVVSLGGKMEIDTRPGKGFCVNIMLPPPPPATLQPEPQKIEQRKEQ